MSVHTQEDTDTPKPRKRKARFLLGCGFDWRRVFLGTKPALYTTLQECLDRLPWCLRILEEESEPGHGKGGFQGYLGSWGLFMAGLRGE